MLLTLLNLHPIRRWTAFKVRFSGGLDEG